MATVVEQGIVTDFITSLVDGDLPGAGTGENAATPAAPWGALMLIAEQDPLTLADIYENGAVMDTLSYETFTVDAVKDVQGMLEITQDGVYGTNTKNAVEAFQGKYEHLTNDGRVGSQTLLELQQYATGNYQ